MSIVDNADQRLVARGLSQEAQERKTDEKSIWWRAAEQPKCGVQGITLRRGKTLDAVEQPQTQLMKRRERELDLRLHSGGTQHAVGVRGAALEVLQ